MRRFTASKNGIPPMLLADPLTIRELITTIRGMNENSCTRKGYFRVHFNEKNMKSSFLTLAAAALLLAGCSKEELTENVAEGVSAVAAPTSQQKNRGGRSQMRTEVWFNQNNGRMLVRLPGNGQTLTDVTANVRNYAISGQEDPNSGNLVDVDGDGVFDYQEWNVELGRVGNSRIYRTEPQSQFVFGQEMYFSLVDVTLTANTFIDDWQGETAYLQLFVYPSGRTAEQDPKVARIRTRSVTNSDSAHEMAVIVSDDPSQDVASVKFVPDPIYGNPDDPTQVSYPEPIILGKTHFNQALGLSRWTGFIDFDVSGTASGTGVISGDLYLLDNGGSTITVISGSIELQDNSGF